MTKKNEAYLLMLENYQNACKATEYLHPEIRLILIKQITENYTASVDYLFSERANRWYET